MTSTNKTLKKLFKQIFSFGSIGLLITLVTIFVYFILFQIFDFPLYSTYTIVYLIAVYVSYSLNAKYTFDKHKNKHEMIKYYLIYFFGLLIGIILLKTISHNFNFTKFVTILFSIPPRIVFTFVLAKFIVFKS